MASKSNRRALPFEPKGAPDKGQKDTVAKSASETTPTPTEKVNSRTRKNQRQASPQTTSTIPEDVSQRMVRRMLIFSGLPTAMGMAIFVAAYFLLSQQVVDFPKVVVLLSTLGCFGLGVIGLSYGVLSASWEPGVVGSRLGWAEFSVNFGRLVKGLRQGKAS